MKNIKNSELSICTCVRIKQRSGAVLAFTQHDADITIDDIIYKAKSGVMRSTVESDSLLSVDNLDIESIIDSDLIKEEDILAGFYDYAEVNVILVDFENLCEIKNIRTGWLGEISVENGKFYTEIRGLNQAYDQTLCQTYSPQCRAKLGDNKCKILLSNYSVDSSVVSCSDGKVILNDTLPDRVYNNGILEILKNGKKFEIFSNKGNEVFLLGDDLISCFEVGDQVVLYQGCDGNIGTCINKFDNAINFRGEPFIPQQLRHGYF